MTASLIIRHVLLLLLFVIFNNNYFPVSAQIPNHNIAEAPVSVSWTTGDLVAFQISNTQAYMRIILFRRIDFHQGIRGFACGFLSQHENDSFVLTVAIVTNYTYVRGLTWYDAEIVWFANRNNSIRKNATLQFLSDGNLILKDADGNSVWSTNTSNKSVVGLKMMENGNLLLHDQYNRTVWQSFDHPTDTLLPGQKLMAGEKLVAKVSETNWSEGNYYLSVNQQGLFAFYTLNSPKMYFMFQVRGERKSLDASYIKAINGTLALYISSVEPSEPDAVFSTPSAMKYMRYDPDGHMRVYSDENEPIDLLRELLNECEYPTVCGNLGLCTNGGCSCPGGYERINSTIYDGCREIRPKKCEDSRSHDLLHLKGVYYFTYVDIDAAVPNETDMESCRQSCLRDCSCQVALFRYFTNSSKGKCLLPSPVFSLINNGEERYVYQSSAFIKISNDWLNASRPATTSFRKNAIIVASSLGAFVMIVVVGIWILIRKKRKAEDDFDEDLDGLPGLPVRFSYEELKVATGNFRKELGAGGFGTVYEGVIGNGEKIAVKRLGGLGQGKKEFLTEVKTIGSIHHVNLVKLIGFCTEKQNRLLVYEFMCNGSLDKWIYIKSPVQSTLDWQMRRNIINDIAKGLAYLHEGCRQTILHLDIKPQNILLDANMCAKISDFGLSKLIDRDQSRTVTTIRGTPGYMAPEWLNSCVTEKADVYSFGIVVLEIICQRKNLEWSETNEFTHLLRVFMNSAEEDRLVDMIESYFGDMQVNVSDILQMMRLALWCLQSDFTFRPSMSTVVKVIEASSDIEVANFNYDVPDLATAAAMKQKKELITTTAVLPSILSGPR